MCRDRNVVGQVGRKSSDTQAGAALLLHWPRLRTLT